MKTIIIYDSKHGFTKECADYLKEQMPDAEMFNIEESYDLNDYDVVYLGSFIYQGEINKPTVRLLEAHRNKLFRKEVFLFCCGVFKEDYFNAMQRSIDGEMFYHLNYICPGGEIRYGELSGSEKRKLKKRVGITESVREFDKEKLDSIVKKAKK